MPAAERVNPLSRLMCSSSDTLNVTAVDCARILAGETGDTYTVLGFGLGVGHSALAWKERGVTGGGKRFNGTGQVSSICEPF